MHTPWKLWFIGRDVSCIMIGRDASRPCPGILGAREPKGARRNAMFAGNGVCSSQSLDQNWGMVGPIGCFEKVLL